MDLRGLSRTQTGSAGAAPSTAEHVPLPKRRWVTRVVLPLAIVLATLAILGYAARQVLIPATPVAVVRAIAVPTGGAQGTSPGEVSGPAKVIVQAPGWAEPDPFPTYISALADGLRACWFWRAIKSRSASRLLSWCVTMRSLRYCAFARSLPADKPG